MGARPHQQNDKNPAKDRGGDILRSSLGQRQHFGVGKIFNAKASIKLLGIIPKMPRTKHHQRKTNTPRQGQGVDFIDGPPPVVINLAPGDVTSTRPSNATSTRSQTMSNVTSAPGNATSARSSMASNATSAPGNVTSARSSMSTSTPSDVEMRPSPTRKRPFANQTPRTELPVTFASPPADRLREDESQVLTLQDPADLAQDQLRARDERSGTSQVEDQQSSQVDDREDSVQTSDDSEYMEDDHFTLGVSEGPTGESASSSVATTRRGAICTRSQSRALPARSLGAHETTTSNDQGASRRLERLLAATAGTSTPRPQAVPQAGPSTANTPPPRAGPSTEPSAPRIGSESSVDTTGREPSTTTERELPRLRNFEIPDGFSRAIQYGEDGPQDVLTPIPGYPQGEPSATTPESELRKLALAAALPNSWDPPILNFMANRLPEEMSSDEMRILLRSLIKHHPSWDQVLTQIKGVAPGTRLLLNHQVPAIIHKLDFNRCYETKLADSHVHFVSIPIKGRMFRPDFTPREGINLADDNEHDSVQESLLAKVRKVHTFTSEAHCQVEAFKNISVQLTKEIEPLRSSLMQATYFAQRTGSNAQTRLLASMKQEPSKPLDSKISNIERKILRDILMSTWKVGESRYLEQSHNISIIKDADFSAIMGLLVRMGRDRAKVKKAQPKLVEDLKSLINAQNLPRSATTRISDMIDRLEASTHNMCEQVLTCIGLFQWAYVEMNVHKKALTKLTPITLQDLDKGRRCTLMQTVYDVHGKDGPFDIGHVDFVKRLLGAGSIYNYLTNRVYQMHVGEDFTVNKKPLVLFEFEEPNAAELVRRYDTF